jgi:hypothetical protein
LICSGLVSLSNIAFSSPLFYLPPYATGNKERPDSQADSLLTYLMLEGSWLPQQRLKACEETDFAAFHERVERVLAGVGPAVWTATPTADAPADAPIATAVASRDVPVQRSRAQQRTDSIVYLHGDMDKEATSKACAVLASKCIPAAAATTAAAAAAAADTGASTDERARVLPVAQHTALALPCFNAADPNSALITYFQAGVNSPRTAALTLLLRRLLGEPAFTELRTKQQLGYIVSLSSCSFGTGLDALRGLTVRILSKRFSPVRMEAVLGEFLTTQRQVLQKVTDEEIAKLSKAIIQSLEDPPTT